MAFSKLSLGLALLALLIASSAVSAQRRVLGKDEKKEKEKEKEPKYKVTICHYEELRNGAGLYELESVDAKAWTKEGHAKHVNDCQACALTPAAPCTKPCAGRNLIIDAQRKRCYCQPGWKGAKCDADVDECALNIDGCDQDCINTQGGYTCACGAGYTLNADGKTCDDIDECALDTDDCEQTCNNIPGSFTCSCADGFTLNPDGKTCTADHS